MGGFAGFTGDTDDRLLSDVWVFRHGGEGVKGGGGGEEVVMGREGFEEVGVGKESWRGLR